MAGVPGSADEYAEDQLRRGVHILLANMGFSSAQESQVNRLVEIWRRKYVEYSQHTRLFMEAAQRTKPIVEDVVAALNHLKVPINEVQDYAKQVKTNVLPPLPMFPALGPTEVDDETHYRAMYGPRPSEREMLIRPPHVPDYLPAMYPEWLPNKGLSDVVLEYEKKKKKDVVKVQVKKKEVKKPLKPENKYNDTIPVFDGMSFEELGFVSDEEEEAPPVFKSDITSATGITSSANLTSLPSRISADISKISRFPTPSHSPKPNDSDSGPSENFRMSDIVKSRVNSPMPFDRPSSSSSMHMYDGAMKPIKFTTKPERPKKEKEPKGPPKPKGRPPKKKVDESYKHNADYLAEQEKRLKMFKENKEREELAAKKLLESISQAQQLENAKKAEAIQQAQQKKLKLILPQNTAKLFSPKSDAIVPSEAATPPISAMVCNPPPVGAEVSVGEVAEEEIQTTGFSQPSSSSAPDQSYVTSNNAADHTLDSTLDSTADEASFVKNKSASISETPSKEKKKKHKEKDRERDETEDSSSSKKHKKKSKDSDEYKEHKRQKKERKRLEKEKQEKEKAEADAKAKTEALAKAKSEAEAKTEIKISQAPIEEPKQKLTLKIKFSDGNGTISGGTGFTSSSMRPESSSSERPGSSRELYEKAAAPPPLKLKFKPLFGPEVTEKKVVPPLKIGMVKKPEEATSSSSSSSLTEKEIRRKEKEKKRERKEKEREKEREREREREEREREKEKEREKRKEEERRQREEEKAREAAKQREEREKEKERQREIEKRKESERREAEKAKEAEIKKEQERQKEKERAREKEKRKEEKRREKEKKHKKREKSREPTPTPPTPPPPPPPPARPIVPILSADDDESSSSEEEEVWICPVCSVAYTEGANMVCCDQCDDWFHWHCVGLVVEPAENVKWYCQRCLGKKKKDLKRPSSRESGGSSKKKRKL